MDSRRIVVNPNPREKANIFSILTWAWTWNIFRKGLKKVLTIEDLYDPVGTDLSNVLGDRLEKQWSAELEKAKRKKRRPSFLRAIARTFAREYLILGLYQILNELILRFATPILLGYLLQYFKPEPEITYEMALYYAGGITLVSFVNVFSQGHMIFGGFHLGGRIRIAISSLVYRKALRLSKTALGDTAPGKIVNLVASDVNRFDVISFFINYLWSAPLSAIIIIALLYVEVGWPALVGMFMLFLVVPFQGYLGKLSSKFRLQTSIKTDERVRLMDEIISGVQVIKMYAWEKPFCAFVELARRLELKVVRNSSFIRGIYMTFGLFTTRIALYGTLITMMSRDQEITAEKVFVYMTYFNMTSITLTSFFVRGIAEVAECKVAVNRLQNFLMYEEFEKSYVSNESTKLSKRSRSNSDLPDIKENINHDDDISCEQLRQNLVLQARNMLENSLKNKQTSNVNFSKHESTRNENLAVKLTHVTAKWDAFALKTTLKDINLEVAKGRLYIVIGMVGSGKSSLISTILGELKLIHGSTSVKGPISFADQDPWVFGASVRQNITFGQKYDKHRYQKVVKVCALESDFQQFPNGDLTDVGERGSSLSGGQRARINLARAVYRQADIYLLDDPLSAVDAHVGKHLFQECIQKYLADKTRILTTHQLQYLEGADAIILMDQGKMQQFSNYHQLLRAYPEYQSLIVENEAIENDEHSIEKINTRRKFSTASTRSRESGAETDGDDNVQENDEQKDRFLEDSSRGAVKGNLLVKYIKSGSNVVVGFLLLFLFLTTQFCVSLYDYFIPILINSEESRYHYKRQYEQSENSSESYNESLVYNSVNLTIMNEEDILPRDIYMYIYTVIALSIFLVGIIRSFAFYTICMRCSQHLHDYAFSALIRATMRFFDTNPSGRILNRFSKDLGTVDEQLPKALLDVGQIYLMTLGSLTVTCVVNPWFLVPILVIGTVSYLLQKMYLRTSTNVKRLEGMSRSPVFTHLNATLNGITTIRAYQSEGILKKEFDRLQDTHTSTWYIYTATSTAFIFSMDFFCFAFIALVTFSFLLLNETFSGGVVGLAITQVMSMAILLEWGFRQSAEITNQLTSVERVLEYSQLSSEPNLRDKGISAKKQKKLKAQQGIVQLIEPPNNWPNQGQVEFKNVFMYYSEEDPAVLRYLTMIIQPGEKVGIVGRTGAGKSSLIAALFRLAKVEGTIEIDGLNTGTIPLEDLRKNISIIPQDPTLFSGTLRRNLDPFDEFSDEILWKVLEEVELKDSVALTGNGLDHRVQNRGSNYSTGQRQLICLARAILRNNRILMLDEATANVDPQTDALIQRTIRTKFAQCTVLTVAHRLNTIIDSDKVLVMDKGELVEFDHPHILLQNESGPFSSLVKESGSAMHEKLIKIAHKSFVSNHADR